MRYGSHAGTYPAVTCGYTTWESPIGITQTANTIRAILTPRSPTAHESADPCCKSASSANSVQPPAASTASSPKPSHTPSMRHATTNAGTFSSAQRITYGNRILIDHATVRRNSNPAPHSSISTPDPYASAVRPGTHGATGCHTNAKSP